MQMPKKTSNKRWTRNKTHPISIAYGGTETSAEREARLRTLNARYRIHRAKQFEKKQSPHDSKKQSTKPGICAYRSLESRADITVSQESKPNSRPARSAAKWASLKIRHSVYKNKNQNNAYSASLWLECHEEKLSATQKCAFERAQRKHYKAMESLKGLNVIRVVRIEPVGLNHQTSDTDGLENAEGARTLAVSRGEPDFLECKCEIVDDISIEQPTDLLQL